MVDKAAEILSSVCQMARERKDASKQPGIKSLTPAPDVPAPLSTTSTLRATVTGNSLHRRVNSELTLASLATC